MKGLRPKGKEDLAALGEEGARGTLWAVCAEPPNESTPSQAGKGHPSLRPVGTRA